MEVSGHHGLLPAPPTAAGMGRLNEPLHASLMAVLDAAGHQARRWTRYTGSACANAWLTNWVSVSGTRNCGPPISGCSPRVWNIGPEPAASADPVMPRFVAPGHPAGPATARFVGVHWTAPGVGLA